MSVNEVIDEIESICIVPDPDNAYDQLWLVVNRENGRFVEFLTNRLQAVDCGDERTSLLEGQVFLDSALSYDNPIDISDITSVGTSTLVSTELAHGFSSGDIVVLSCAGDFDGRFEVEEITSPCDDSVILALEFEGADGSTIFDDLSCYNNTITVGAGSPAIDTAQSKIGLSSLINGGYNNYIDLGSDNSVKFKTTWTVECWFKINSYLAAGNHICLYKLGGGDPVPVPPYTILGFVANVSNPNFTFEALLHNGINPIAVTSSVEYTLSLNTWYHVAYVFDISNSLIQIYFNGVLVAETSGSFSSGGSGNPSIGFNLNGWIDGYRISNFVKYSSDFTPSTEPYSPVSATTSFRILDAVLGSQIDSSSYTAYEQNGYARLAADTFEGLEHLEGETVGILADGEVQEEQVVSGGSVVLSSEFGLVTVGLPYFSDVQLLPVEQN